MLHGQRDMSVCGVMSCCHAANASVAGQKSQPANVCNTMLDGLRGFMSAASPRAWGAQTRPLSSSPCPGPRSTTVT